LVALAIAACGGGGQQVSAEELVQKGDDICTEVQERFAEIQRAPPASASDGADQAAELLEVADGAETELQDLEPPEELRDAYARYLDLRERVNDLIQAGKDAAQDQDGAAYGKAQEEAAKGAPERRRVAKELGFKVCSQDQQAP
jgi:hypothetical protein